MTRLFPRPVMLTGFPFSSICKVHLLEQIYSTDLNTHLISMGTDHDNVERIADAGSK